MRQDHLEGRGKVSYETIHEWALDVPISAKAYKLWQILRFHWMRGLRSSMPSHDELAARLHLSAPGGARSVARYLNELQGQGMFGRDKDEEGRTQTRDKGGHFGGCTFWVWVGEDRPLTPAEKESLELQEDLPGLEEPQIAPEAITPPGGMNSAVLGADHRQTPVSIGGETTLSIGRGTPMSTGSNKEGISSGTLEREPPLSPGPHREVRAPTTRVVRPPRFQTDDDRGQAEADWLAFIEAYPVRGKDQGHPEGRRKLEQLIAHGTGIQTILAGARRFKEAYADKIGTTFIPKMGKWLNERGWEDEIRMPDRAPGGARSEEPQQGVDYKLVPNGVGTDLVDIVTGLLFDSSAWFAARGLTPTKRWRK